jgi:hypothetical protein
VIGKYNYVYDPKPKSGGEVGPELDVKSSLV